MKINIEEFVRARDYVLKSLSEKVDVYIIGIWNPFIQHNIVKETTELVQQELIELFPDFPPDKLPQCRVKLLEDIQEINIGIQNYFNPQYGLIYLGTSTVSQDEVFDFYFRKSYDPQFNYRFIARFGHGENDYMTGSKTAEAEYNLGQYTPLSIAYGIAVEDGFIG